MDSSLTARSLSRSPTLKKDRCQSFSSFGISGRFQPLFPGKRQIIHVLLTLPPQSNIAATSFDLHASSTPSAFNLNQDQILNENDLLTIKNDKAKFSFAHTNLTSLYSALFLLLKIGRHSVGVLFFSL